MDSFEGLARARFSVRRFSDRPVEQDRLDRIIAAGMVAPTAVNYQPQRVYVLRSREALDKANALCPCMYGAPVILLVAYDDERDWDNPRQEDVHSGEQDASIVATHMMLQAWELGIGSCWVNLFSNDEVSRAFGLPTSERSVLLMPLGYPADDAKPHPRWHDSSRPVEDVVTYL